MQPAQVHETFDRNDLLRRESPSFSAALDLDDDGPLRTFIVRWLTTKAGRLIRPRLVARQATRASK